jgi:energy-converting hydrogenase Eha subunit E
MSILTIVSELSVKYLKICKNRSECALNWLLLLMLYIFVNIIFAFIIIIAIIKAFERERNRDIDYTEIP